jgi:isoleucyl-tRNA synthetase
MRRLCVLLAPFTPHVTETMYQNLRLSGDPESVHMLSWFPGDEKGIDRGLEQGMEIVRSFDEAQAYARQSGKRKLRWPVRECVVVTDEDDVEAAMTSLSDICRERANAREVRVARGRYDRSGWKAEPVMKALGPAFGKKAPRVKELILAAEASCMKASLDRGETVILESNGESFSIVASQVSFSEELPPGVFSAPMKGGVVYLDITLTPEIEAEGYAREIIRRIQEMRRRLDLKVEDYVEVFVTIDDVRVAGLLSGTWEDVIRDEVRAMTIKVQAGSREAGDRAGLLQDWDVEGVAMVMGVSKAADKAGEE